MAIIEKADVVTTKGIECPDRVTVWVWLVIPLALAALLVAVPHISTEFYMTWIDDEKTGVLQALHWVIPLWGFIVAGRILMMRQNDTGVARSGGRVRGNLEPIFSRLRTDTPVRATT